jgi:hypothetical protein
VTYSRGTVRSSSLAKGVYNPKAFIPHAALLHPTCVDCAKFLAAASRRSLGRISVPVWLTILSDQLRIVALVGRYPTNKLIRRTLLRWRLSALVRRPYAVLASLSGSCPPPPGRFVRVTHPSATRAEALVRLACIRHAANVYPEPGSNSPKQQTSNRRSGSIFLSGLDVSRVPDIETPPSRLPVTETTRPVPPDGVRFRFCALSRCKCALRPLRGRQMEMLRILATWVNRPREVSRRVLHLRFA